MLHCLLLPSLFNATVSLWEAAAACSVAFATQTSTNSSNLLAASTGAAVARSAVVDAHLSAAAAAATAVPLLLLFDTAGGKAAGHSICVWCGGRLVQAPLQYSNHHVYHGCHGWRRHSVSIVMLAKSLPCCGYE